VPVPGPRTQNRDLTARNPDGEHMRFFERTPYHGIPWLGRSAATMERTLRGCVLAAGQIRKLWRQSVTYYAGQAPYSWTDNRPRPDAPSYNAPHGFGITRALRYRTLSVYAWGGADNSRFSELHTVVLPRARSKPVTVPAGAKRTAPTVRNRLTSFGSRVTPVNSKVDAAESSQ
jgi:hypothetical protein